MFSNQLKTIVIFLSLIFNLSYTISSSAVEVQLENGDTLKLFGIGIHQEKRNDIYLGSLFAPKEITSINQLFNTSVSKRMNFKFLSKYSNRKLSRLWKQRIAMNNPKDNWRPLTKEIVNFSKLFKRSMKRTDEINIDYIPNKGTDIYLNKTLFLTINNIHFYELLLNVWLGPIPPTESFKTGITGNNSALLNEQLAEKFEQLKPEVGRFDDDKKSIEKPIRIAKKATNKTKNNSTAKKVENIEQQSDFSDETKNMVNNILNSQATTVPIVKTTVDTNKQDSKNLFKIDLGFTKAPVKRVVEDDVPTKINKPKNSNEIAGSDIIEDNTNNLLNEIPPPKTNNAIENNTSELEKVAILDLPEEDFFDVDLLIGSYTLELINNLRLKQSYPARAHRSGKEGELTVQIKIDKLGQIISNQIIVKSGSRVLDRGVLRMVRKAAPFPVIPEELALDEFEFDVPLSFKIAK